MEDERGASTAAGAQAALPDINEETYPFEVVQRLIDRAAHFNMLSLPDRAGGGAAIANGNGTVGLRIREVLHRFEIRMELPGRSAGLRAANVVGEPAASFEHRWLLVPDDWHALPDREPPATVLDPSRSQRFAMLDSVCRFGDGRDGFRGFGTGSTLPCGDGRLLAAAVGNVMEGFGRLAGREGTYLYCGEIDPRRGFTGNLMLRVVDPGEGLGGEGDLPTIEPMDHEPEPGITYLLLRGQKRGRGQKTGYRFGPDGAVIGLDVEQDLRLVDLGFAARGRGGLRTTRSVGPVVGRMTARIDFNLLDPGAPGTGTAPIPFSSFNEYTIFDRDGREIGGFCADGTEGRTFLQQLAGAPGQQALRFGGFGPLLDGTGPFAGIQGLMTDNSVVGIAPHALATLYVLRIHDPDGRYRCALSSAWR